MGFLDRFKKKENKDSINYGAQSNTNEIYKREMLSLRHSDGRTDNIYFDGLKEVEGKTLMEIGIEDYANSEGTTRISRYYIEPKYYTNENGETIEWTADYYKQMGRDPKDGGNKEWFNACKGFFQPSEITKQKMGSNYIGSLEYSEEKSKYYRGYDLEFRQKYIQITRARDEYNEKEKALRKENERTKRYSEMEKGKLQQELENNTLDGTDYDITHPAKGEAGMLSQDDPASRYTQMI